MMNRQRYLDAVAVVTEAMADGMSDEWEARAASEPGSMIRALVHLVIDTAAVYVDQEAGVILFDRQRAVGVLRDLAAHVALVDATTDQ